MSSERYITTIPNEPNTGVVEKIEELRREYGSIRLRGRHSDRKAVLGWKWRRHSQNDIPIEFAERIAIYKRDEKNRSGRRA